MAKPACRNMMATRRDGPIPSQQGHERHDAMARCQKWRRRAQTARSPAIRWCSPARSRR
jgi:hypothetical protein